MLNESTLRERHGGAVANDDVVQEAYVDQGERLLDPLSDQFIGLARFGDAGGVVVGVMCP